MYLCFYLSHCHIVLVLSFGVGQPIKCHVKQVGKADKDAVVAVESMKELRMFMIRKHLFLPKCQSKKISMKRYYSGVKI